MNADLGPAPNASAVPLAPVLRTVLVADLVDSTAVLNALGDNRGATLMQRLELHLRDLLAIRGGLLIDKADGVLALFERPVQAVDFALRYQRLLTELGTEFGVPGLTARVGIHVGEVMTWANDPRAVAAGAKPIEVEGLAKPVAARLMSLALPGQVLMSGMAQSLAQRAAGELGERGSRLRWMMHGRFRFKGVPTPMLVHEVGEEGVSPLRAPPSGEKSWRVVPMWRRPLVLSVEVLAVLGLGFASLYGTFKSEPALAFYERDWIVVADLNNLTTETELSDPLETALRVGLQQSPYVNLVSDIRVEQTLERMGRDLDSPIDREIGAEIAAREDARAVLLPTLTEVGGRLQISLEVVDPNSKRTVFSDAASASGSRELLAAMDDVIQRMRGRLGETVASIDQRSAPLAEVTTSNIEALRAYSLGLEARTDYRIADAFALQQQAIRLDPDFALAYAALASLYFTENDNPKALANIQEALARKDKLTVREQLYLDAVSKVYSPLEDMLASWKTLSMMYPDDYRAYYNYAFFASRRGFGYDEALQTLTPALAQSNPHRVSAYFLRGGILLSMDRQVEALDAFRQSESLGLRGYKGTYASAYASQRDFANAARILQSQEPSGMVSKDAEHQLTLAAIEADQGRIEAAIRRLSTVRRDTALPSEGDLRFLGSILQLRSFAPDPAFAADLGAYRKKMLDEFAHADISRRGDLAFMLLTAASLAARHGDTQGAAAILESTEAHVSAARDPHMSSLRAMAEAEIDLAKGNTQGAIDRLSLSVESGQASYGARALLMRALARNGDTSGARAQAKWLATHRGRAYGEFGHSFMTQATNVVESDLALLALHDLALAEGDAAEAERYLDEFRAAWPGTEGSQAAASRSAEITR